MRLFQTATAGWSHATIAAAAHLVKFQFRARPYIMKSLFGVPRDQSPKIA